MLAFWEVGEVLLIIAVGVLAITQIFWPMFTKQPLFPSFRRRARHLSHQLEQVEGEIQDTQQELVIKERQKKLDLLKESATVPTPKKRGVKKS